MILERQCIIPVMKSLDETETFMMIPEQIVDIPGLAKKCKWIDSEIEDINDKTTFLQNHQFKKILTFEVLEVNKSGLGFVKIWPYEEQENYEEIDSDRLIFTSDELEELYEEPLNTENALIAINGYATKDDENFCRFYDPKIGGCFKGGSCKLKHLPASDDAYECRDREEILIKKEDYDYIILNESYEIVITAFRTVNRFIFRFDDPEYKDKAQQIQNKVNDPRNCKSFKKISHFPEIDQLVIIKKNEEFFRAKVIEHESHKYIVWCLDFGHLESVYMDMMYDFVMCLQDIPFITHETEISKICPVNANNRFAMKRLMGFQHKLRALIT